MIKNEKKNIVIIGGGFAGVNLATKLGNTIGLNVTVIDKNNYNFFTPLLYQLSTGFLDVASICLPFRTIFKGKNNIHFRMGEVQKIVPEEHKVILTTETISYDYLVIAVGTKPNFFGMENIQKNALPMKSVEDSVKLRNMLISKAEHYIQSNDPDEKRKMRNIVISGAGPSGVELAGVLAEIKNSILGEIYPELDGKNMNIYLVDGVSSVLHEMSKTSQKYSQKSLEDMGIKVQLGKTVSDYKNDKVEFKDGSHIETKMLIWTSGVVGIKLEGITDDFYTKGDRLKVNEYNEIEGLNGIYAIGDACIMNSDSNFPKGHPQLASVAKQQGLALAKNFKAEMKGEKLFPFKYNDKGTMAIIGRNKAVADLTTPEKTLTGFIAWLAWTSVHVFLLLSYRNQIRTMWNWANNYFSKAQSQGVLVGEKPEEYKP